MVRTLIIATVAITVFSAPSFGVRKKSSVDAAVTNIIVAENTIKTRTEQLIQVTMKNRSKKTLPLVLRLRITSPQGSSFFHGRKKIIAGPESEQKILFRYWVKPRHGGKYQVAAWIYDGTGKKILLKSPKTKNTMFFALGKKVKKAAVTAPTVKPPEPAEFEKPDLVWTMNNIAEPQVLRGDSTTVRLQLTNQGGDTAKNVEYELYWFFTKRPNRKNKIPRDGNTFKFIAPGETKVFETPVTLTREDFEESEEQQTSGKPRHELKGEYRVFAVVDPQNRIKETDEDNNVSESNDIVYRDISLQFPPADPEGYALAGDGAVSFRWRSYRYNQFKIQISADPTFPPEDTLEAPKGDEKWAYLPSLRLLDGEWIIAAGIMRDKEAKFLYWRVRAQNSQGEISESETRKIRIYAGN